MEGKGGLVCTPLTINLQVPLLISGSKYITNDLFNIHRIAKSYQAHTQKLHIQYTLKLFNRSAYKLCTGMAVDRNHRYLSVV